MQPDPHPIELGYAADVPTRHGIVYDIGSGHARITVPPPRRLLYWLTELALPGLGICCVAAMAAAALASHARRPQSGDLLSVLSDALYWGVLLGGYCVWRWVRRRRQVTEFELDGGLLTVRDRDGWSMRRTRSYRREEIAHVATGPVPWNAPRARGLGLHIRITGKEVVEVMPGHDPAVAEWVAARLNDAIAVPAPTLPGTSS